MTEVHPFQEQALSDDESNILKDGRRKE